MPAKTHRPGEIRCSGKAGGDHLHFEVIVGGVPVRPEKWKEEKWMGDVHPRTDADKTLSSPHRKDDMGMGFILDSI